MCGRFLFNMEVDEAMKSYNISKNSCGNIEVGEKFPGAKIPIIFNEKSKNTLMYMRWGIKYTKNIINARFETVDEKPLFHGLLKHNRCIIPASSYYEWKNKGNKKEKIEIFLRDSTTIALGGIYGIFQNPEGNDEECVVILTVPAAKSIEDIHTRMPLIISKDLVADWVDTSINNINKTQILKRHYEHALVTRNCEGNEQMSFF